MRNRPQVQLTFKEFIDAFELSSVVRVRIGLAGVLSSLTLVIGTLFAKQLTFAAPLTPLALPLRQYLIIVTFAAAALVAYVMLRLALLEARRFLTGTRS